MLSLSLSLSAAAACDVNKIRCLVTFQIPGASESKSGEWKKKMKHL